MTADYRLDALYELKNFLWSQMVQEKVLNPKKYYSDNLGETISPIIPVQQSPEMNQFLSGKAHIVVDKIGISYEDNWMICNEQFLFTIYSTDLDEISIIRNFMIDLFRRMDDSARDVNWWEGLSDKFKFYSIHINDISPTAPSEDLQGFYATDIILEAKYSRILDNVGRFA